MPDISFVYILQAVLDGSWSMFIYWIGAGMLVSGLALAMKAYWRRRKLAEGTHLLIQIRQRQAFNTAGIICCTLAMIWNARHMWPEPYLYAALTAELMLGLYRFKHTWKVSSSCGTGVITFATAAVLAVSPMALSPVMLLASGYAVYDKTEWKRLTIGLIAVPTVALICAEVIRNPLQWSGLAEVFLLICLTACALLAIKYRKSMNAYRERLSRKENERHLERQRMDELELSIIKTERENLLNMLDIRRKEVRENAEKITDQSLFMQDIYESICEAQRNVEPERSELLQKIKSKIQLRMNFTDERTNFAQQVEDLHKDFNIRLQARFPDLSAQERKLAAMLRLEFPTKYMAATLNISPKSVEIERHRLRKKFGLDRKTKLTEFVKTI